MNKYLTQHCLRNDKKKLLRINIEHNDKKSKNMYKYKSLLKLKFRTND